MKRIFLVGLAAIALAATGTWYLACSQQDQDSAVADEPLRLENEAAAAEPSPSHTAPNGPRAVVEQNEYNFGTMDALQQGSHKFTLRNEGNQPLSLKASGTTCRCTVSDVPTDSILPGQTGEIEVRWNTGSAEKHYAQTATVSTNDPKSANIMFRVFGSIRNRILVEPGEFVFSRVEPDKVSEAGTLIYSQVWPKFSLRDFQCSLPGFQWNVERVELPADDELARGNCYRISLTTAPGLEPGHFSGTLSFTLAPEAKDAEPQSCELLISGKVLRRLAVYGPQIDSDGIIELGRLPHGQPHRATLLVKIRDAQPELDFERVEAEPRFVQARIVADSEQERQKGIYRLHLEIPADAPPCEYWETPGHVKIVTDHPRIGEVTLKLRFGVVGKL